MPSLAPVCACSELEKVLATTVSIYGCTTPQIPDNISAQKPSSLHCLFCRVQIWVLKAIQLT